MAKYRFDNMDAAESIHFSRELEALRSQSYDVQFPEFKGRQFVPVDNSVNEGAEVVTYRTFEEVGYAEWARDYTKGPRVDLFGTETTTKIRTLKAAYGYAMQEARAARMSGRPLDARKAMAARRAIEQLIDQAAFVGDKVTGGLLGLLNQSSTTTYTVPNGAAASPLWANKTPDEILTDLFGMESAIITGTLDIEKPDTLVLPLSSYQQVATRRLGDGSDTTILKHFLANAVSVNTVLRSHKLESDDAAYGETVSVWTGKRAVMYTRSPEKLQLVIPMEYNQLPPQFDGYEVVTHCEARTGGVVVYYPKSICYADNI